MAKTLERCSYEVISSFVENFKLLTPFQHGFRKNKNIESATNELLDFIYTEMDQGNFVASLLFDLTKAFDSLDFNFISEKIEKFGIRGPMLQWIKSYLQDRSFMVKLNNITSDKYSMVLGVPQGSVLGPLIFLLFVNDLPKFITHGKVTMFADDTTITVSAQTMEALEESIRNTCGEMKDWCKRNRLLINSNKTKCIYYNTRKRLPMSSSISNHTNGVDSVKLLGTHLDSQLSFRNQIDFVCAKLNQAFYMILQMKSVLEEKELLNLYFAHAYSHLSYNIISWGLATDWERVFVCQKRILRMIFGLNFRETCKDIFKDKGLLTFPCIYIMKCSTTAHRSILKLNSTKPQHNYLMRHNNLYVPRHKTSKFRKSPSFNCIKLYNALPQRLKSLPSYIQFKRETKKWLVEKSFYSVKDYIDGHQRVN